MQVQKVSKKLKRRKKKSDHGLNKTELKKTFVDTKDKEDKILYNL